MPTPSEEFRLPPVVPGFQFLDWVGEGGMGEVYLAREVTLGRVVALKFLTLDPQREPEDQVRWFEREVELMGKLSHPNIVAVYNSGKLKGRPYLVMEYVQGNNLRQEMESGGSMDLDRIRSLAAPLVEALDYLHTNKILHCDLKPENILIGPGFTPKLADFGIAVENAGTGVMRTTGRWMGTPGYTAPEQQFGLKVDARADQFSLAAVVYELLTGQRAWGVFKPPSYWNKDLDERVDAVFHKALMEDPADRFANIREFGDELDLALQPAPAPPPEARPWISRRAAMAAAAVILPGIVYVGWREFLRLPLLWRNSLGMEFHKVPKGEFRMGSPSSDPWSNPEETPPHLVTLTRSLFVCRREVTVAQFEKFTIVTGYLTECEDPKKGGLGGHVYDPSTKLARRSPSFTWRNPTGNGKPDPNTPVTQVTWNDAIEFCKWLTDFEKDREERHPYRLPTEAEWEYACRAGSMGRWCMGDSISRLNDFAWTSRNSDKAQKVAGRNENAFGLFDMHGNVWEWCRDAPHAYTEGSEIDPFIDSDDKHAMLRGGAWDCEDLSLTRSAARLDAPKNYACSSYGFRIVADIDRPA